MTKLGTRSMFRTSIVTPFSYKHLEAVVMFAECQHRPVDRPERPTLRHAAVGRNRSVRPPRRQTRWWRAPPDGAQQGQHLVEPAHVEFVRRRAEYQPGRSSGAQSLPLCGRNWMPGIGRNHLATVLDPHSGRDVLANDRRGGEMLLEERLPGPHLDSGLRCPKRRFRRTNPARAGP